MERIAKRGLWLALGVLAGGVAAWAQTPATPSPTAPSSQGGCYDTDANGKQVFIPNCGLPAAPERKHATVPGATSDPAVDPSKQFPFPGEPGTQPAAQNPQVKTAAPGGATDPAKAFPFPGEADTPLVQPDGSVAPVPAQKPGGLTDAGSSGQSTSDDSSSSSSSSSSSPLSGLPDDPATKGPLADDPDAVIKKPRRKDPPVKERTPTEREQEDLNVADFYMNDANYRGAYTRAADAVASAADDPNAHFALAEAARKLGKLDQAVAEYKKTLTLDPVPKQKKAVEKALKEMTGG